MKRVLTATLTPTTIQHLTNLECLLVYNALDTMITYEVLDALLPQLTPVTSATYAFSRALQGPILEMNARGVLIDIPRRDEVVAGYRQETVRLAAALNRMLREGLGFDFEVAKNRTNFWPSDTQLRTLFYDIMNLPPQYKRTADGKRLTVDREALEKLEHYFYAEPIVKHLYKLRDLAKKIQFLSTAIDPDQRIRTSFNIAGTNTGRLASSYSDFGTGTNLQNVENKLRSVFIADPGWKFCNIDLEQSDSRAVGAIHWNLFRNPSYLDACESGDLHTQIAKIAFPGAVKDRDSADQKFYREFSYRDAAKRLGHGSNYGGQADKMARATHIPIGDIQAFQTQYFRAFPAFRLWWEWVEMQVRTTKQITTLLGRRRHFFGHHLDSDTIRAAIAYEPQSVTADTINRGLLAVWKTGRVQPLLQVHDSILFQYRQEEEDEIVPAMLSLCEQTVRLSGGRSFQIPAEAKVGWNWSDDKADPDSLQKWKGQDTRRRQRAPNKSRFNHLGL
jgi:DNA polymerase-1